MRRCLSRFRAGPRRVPAGRRPGRQGASQIATDLHTRLRRGNVPGTYVLAGHSFGGLYVLTYAARYPDQIAGMVVVDTTAPRETPPAASPEEPNGYDPVERVATLISTSARLGLTRLYAPTEGGGLPPTSRDAVRASITAGSILHELRREAGGGADPLPSAAMPT